MWRLARKTLMRSLFESGVEKDGNSRYRVNER